jgi:Tol biopolymer transport system component
MGEVYRARDSKLNRDVALKVLLPEVAGDPERLARFRREAQILASLNHPNIAHIYGLEEADGRVALVLELVEGPTLADRIATGPIRVDDALPIARQIAEGLEAAHEQGIVHRDLKPANIKVREDGTVKVLDFGLAKAMDPIATSGVSVAAVANSPTITSPALMTGLGMLIGTAAYMSPEQAKGRPADKRSDLWAFGCVLFEMLAGKRAFTAVSSSNSASGAEEAEAIAEVLAAVLGRPPDWSALPSTTPAGVRRLLQRCLDRDRRQRLQSAADARLRLEEIVDAPEPMAHTTAVADRSLGWIAAVIGLTIVALVLAVPTIRHLREAAPLPALEMRTEIVTPPTAERGSFAISPDGRYLAFAGENDGHSQLWLRRLASSTAEPLGGTEGGTRPFWAPDSESLAFFAGGKLRVLDRTSGHIRVLTDAVGSRGGTWNAAGVVLFAAANSSALFQIPAIAAGAPKPVTRLDQQLSHAQPQFLPDGRHFIYYGLGNADHTGVYLGALDSDVVTRLTPADAAGAFLPAGWLVWPRDGTLWAQPFDITNGVLTGTATAMSGSVVIELNGMSAVSASASGLLALRSGSAKRQLQWFDRGGRPLGVVDDPDEASLTSPRLSPDGKLVAVYRTVNANADVWVLDGSHKTRITTDPLMDRFPIWSPDGRSLIFESNRSNLRQLYMTDLETRVEHPLPSTTHNVVPQSWSSDNRFVLYAEQGPARPGDFDLWVLPLTEDRQPFAVVKTAFTEKGGDFSPNGRWIAYMSDQSGRPEIYVKRFVQPGSSENGREVQVSTAGGIYPRWAPNGSELYWLAPDATVTAARVRTSAPTFEYDPPISLFRTRVLGGGMDNQQGSQFDVTQDGRFLINAVLDDATPITLIQNWTPPPTR